MSESAAKPRQPVDLGEFERRLRGPERPRTTLDDPLAELARLVDRGQSPLGEDTVRTPVGSRPAAPVEPHYEHADLAPAVEAHQPHGAAQAGFEPQPQQANWNQVMSAWEAEKATALNQPVGASTGQPNEFHNQRHDRMDAAGAGYEPAAAQAYPQSYPYDELPPPPAEQAPRRSRMGAYAMAGALGVVALGVAGTFAMKSGPGGSRDAPMIKAASGPAKVQPESAAAAAPTQTASVLDKGNEKLTTSKIVGGAEQPVDVSAQMRQPKPANGSPATPAGASIFPEPKRVKTVSVRPDGSIISADIPVATTGAANTAVAVPTPRPVVAAPAATRSIASPSLAPAAAPKATARVAARTPAPVDDDDDDTPAAKPAAKPTAKPAAKPATAPAPKAAVDPKPVAGGGGFAVQMGVAASDAEARAKASQVQAKFGSNLGGRRASVVKAEVNGKTVYRVRVVGLSQEGAADMCGKVKGGGGDCFVAR